MIGSMFSALFRFLDSRLGQYLTLFVSQQSLAVMKIGVVNAAFLAAIIAMYVGINNILQNTLFYFPPGTIFYGFMWMMITPNLPKCIMIVASGYFIIKAYQITLAVIGTYTAISAVQPK